uniref:Uncharacterized protein n=2 Tax=Phytophthora fragariae TaxID=53985 RepID=A0A6A3EPP9_9STRA|nr:hypothetical protein PF009_g14515 [Phytophthora fragariae]
MALVAVLTVVLHWLCMLQRRRGWWRRPSSSMASCGWPAARFVAVGGVHGGFGGANGPVLFCLLLLQRCPARVTEDCGGVRAADCMLQLPSSKVRGRWWRT